jgi:hypothetical protein
MKGGKKRGPRKVQVRVQVWRVDIRAWHPVSGRLTVHIWGISGSLFAPHVKISSSSLLLDTHLQFPVFQFFLSNPLSRFVAQSLIRPPLFVR